MTTIGGVVFRYLDRLPVVGDKVSMDGLVATVLAMEGHRMAKVHIAKGALDEEEDAPAEVAAEQAESELAETDETSGPIEAEKEGTVAEEPEAEEPNAPQADGQQGSKAKSGRKIAAAEVVELNLPKSKTSPGCGPATIRAGKASGRRES